MANQRITKRIVDGLKARERELRYGIRRCLALMSASGRPAGSLMLSSTGRGQGAWPPCGATTIASVGKITPESARIRARAILGQVADREHMAELAPLPPPRHYPRRSLPKPLPTSTLLIYGIIECCEDSSPHGDSSARLSWGNTGEAPNRKHWETQEDRSQSNDDDVTEN
jgi:hypothetical protein